MIDQFSRTKLLTGEDKFEKLSNCRVAVFGVGGVGGYVVEALVRSGLGSIDIIDNDTFYPTNLNRQIFALNSTLGEYKVDVAKERILDINPLVNVVTYKVFYTDHNADDFDFSMYDYIVDAIDTVAGKLSLIEKSKEYNIPIISSMGTGNKLDPTKLEVTDISKTSVCPLARVIRTELKKRKISGVKVVYSKEAPISHKFESEEKTTKHKIVGSSAFVPAAAGLIIAAEVVKDLISN